MNRRTIIGLIGLSALVALLWLGARARRQDTQPSSPSTEPKVSTQSETAAPAHVTPPSAAMKPLNALPEPPPSIDPVMVENAGTAGEVVRLNASQVLGRVNGVAITLKDLIPLDAVKAAGDQLLPRERFEFLLDRAVDREVTVQAARSQGVSLSGEQLQRLAEHKARSSTREDGVFDTLQHGPESTDFQQRDLSAMALQHTLAEKAGVPSPYVTTEHVATYFEQYRGEYQALPADPAQRQAAWEIIEQDIRSKLAPGMQARHDEAMKKFGDQLRASAQISVAKP
jgi:hypothetical protein